MYRAKAEAVSGTKVYAGGKWLKCIGNKPVRVGESVWTDGKVVYGNYREAQQPPVITTPQDEAIPIVILDGQTLKFFTFKKNKLVLVMEETDSSLNISKPPVMLNDKSKTILFRKNREVTVEDQRIRLLAANISNGTVFDIVEKMITDDNDDLKSLTVEIRSDGIPFKTFDILSAYNSEIFDECPSPLDLPFTPAYAGGIDVYNRAFIENEKNWWFTWRGFASKSLSDEYTGSYPESGLDPNPFIGFDNHFYLQKHFVYTNDKQYLFCYFYSERTYDDNYDWHYPDDPCLTRVDINEFPDLNEIKFMLQDSYYCKLRLYEPGDAYMFFIDVFNPDNEKIIDGEKFLKNESLLLFCHPLNNIDVPLLLVKKIGVGRYLFERRGDIFTIEDGKVNWLALGGACANERLRPMKKTKGWEKRITEFNFI